MHIIVVGCGRLGADLAYRLFQREHEVVVIDQVAAAFDNLHPLFRGRTVEGEVLNQDVLHRAGIERTDGLAAVTNSDTLNAVVAHVARTIYHTPHVVARNYNPRWKPLHEAFGLQAVCSTTWGAQRIEEMLYEAEVHPVWSSGNGVVDLYEFVVPEHCQGRLLHEILPAGPYVVVAFTRAGQPIAPAHEIPLESGDVIYLSPAPEGRELLRSWLTSQQRA
ncbi:MAG: potassium channel family protein [Candidatus Entotheonellia bacterium]